jgi:hypothetical protein
MNQPHPTFRFTSHVYLWIALIAWCGLPLWATAIGVLRGTGEMSSVFLGAVASVAIAFVVRFVGARCGGGQLSFMDGLLYITCFLQTGWTYTSLLTVLVGVLLALAGSVWIVLTGLVQGTSGESYQQSFHGLVAFFHRNRMVQ